MAHEVVFHMLSYHAHLGLQGDVWEPLTDQPGRQRKA